MARSFNDDIHEYKILSLDFNEIAVDQRWTIIAENKKNSQIKVFTIFELISNIHLLSKFNAKDIFRISYAFAENHIIYERNWINKNSI